MVVIEVYVGGGVDVVEDGKVVTGIVIGMAAGDITGVEGPALGLGW